MINPDDTFLYCCQTTRRAELETLKIYTDGFHGRLIPTLDNISEEADKAENDCWNGETPSRYSGYDDGDLGSLAEEAIAVGQEVYQNLHFVRAQLIQLAVAGLYHLWERTLKQFLIKELFRYDGEKIRKAIERDAFKELVNRLKQFDYDLAQMAYYKSLNELKLVANVVKHGNGASFKELAEAAPHLFRTHVSGFLSEPSVNNLEISPLDFIRYSESIKEFWVLFPERAHHKADSK